MMKSREQGPGIGDEESNRIVQLVRDSMPPIGASLQPAPELWPAMLRRINEHTGHRAALIPWFDWALAGGLMAFTAIAPRTIPIILYYL
jgi:hypothetical protein